MNDKRKTPWGKILGILLVLLIVLCIILGIAIYRKMEVRTVQDTNREATDTEFSFCADPGNKVMYENNLQEAGLILQTKAEDFLHQGKLAVVTNCVEFFPQRFYREKRFLECYALIKRTGLLNVITGIDLEKVTACKDSICERNKGIHPSACDP